VVIPIRRTAIVGAGLTRCTVTWRLAPNGIQSVLFERAQQPGGVIRSEHLNGVLYEPHGSHILYDAHSRSDEIRA
jgi:protoporphyrinogen oxidase